MRIRFVHPFIAVALVVAACHRGGPKPLEIGSVLPTLPLPPGGQALVREGGSEAMQFVFVTPVMPDSIVAFYRIALSTGAFRLVNESTTGKSTAFYAEQDGPPIWVTVSPNGAEGSQVIIAGAKDATGRPMAAPTAALSDTGTKARDAGSAAPLPIRKP